MFFIKIKKNEKMKIDKNENEKNENEKTINCLFNF